jgi:hypothetical protein
MKRRRPRSFEQQRCGRLSGETSRSAGHAGGHPEGHRDVCDDIRDGFRVLQDSDWASTGTQNFHVTRTYAFGWGNSHIELLATVDYRKSIFLVALAICLVRMAYS